MYKGNYKGNEVAIKIFSGLTTQSNNNEIDIFTKIRSPYVVNFYGICRTTNSMVIEFCKYGSIESCYGNKKLTNDVKELMCYDCAMGMNVFFYLVYINTFSLFLFFFLLLFKPLCLVFMYLPFKIVLFLCFPVIQFTLVSSPK